MADPRPLTEILEAMQSKADADNAFVTKAYEFAKRAHENQKRFSGDPYFVHAAEVGYSLAEAGMDRVLRTRQMTTRTSLTVDSEYESLPSDFLESRALKISGNGKFCRRPVIVVLTKKNTFVEVVRKYRCE